MCVCNRERVCERDEMFVCVCVRERERESERMSVLLNTMPNVAVE